MTEMKFFSYSEIRVIFFEIQLTLDVSKSKFISNYLYFKIYICALNSL